MSVFLTAGILYLIGVAVILIWKPSLMFTESGDWKEFGIGRNPNTHTWMPIWLFIILWAIISFILSGLINRLYGSSKTSSLQQNMSIDTIEEVSPEELISPIQPKSRRNKSDLKPGYYILNREATEDGGVPKYVYLGAELK